MRRAKKDKGVRKNINVKVFSDINVTLNFDGKSQTINIVVCVIAVLMVAALLVTLNSYSETLKQLSSFLSDFGS